MLTPTMALHWGRKITVRKQAQKTNIFFVMRRNYKRTRGHKRCVYKYSLHVNNCEMDQEKQNKSVAR